MIGTFVKTCLVSFAFAVTMAVCHGQVAMKLELDHKNYLVFEGIKARLTVRNDSGRALAFSETDAFTGELLFEIEDSNLIYNPKLPNQAKLLRGVVLAPGVIKSFNIPLSHHFSRKRGRFRIKALIKHSQMEGTYESDWVTFTVSDGVVVWKRLIGLPKFPDESESAATEPRLAKIISFYDGEDKVFYLTIEDSNKYYLVTRIGYDVGTSIPDCDVDALSRIHIVLQENPDVFSYFVYDIGGGLERREVYKKTTTSPGLFRSPQDGSVSILGGKKAQKGVDYDEEAWDVFDMMKTGRIGQ